MCSIRKIWLVQKYAEQAKKQNKEPVLYQNRQMRMHVLQSTSHRVTTLFLHNNHFL